jgi:hypothetical protein
MRRREQPRAGNKLRTDLSWDLVAPSGEGTTNAWHDTVRRGAQSAELWTIANGQHIPRACADYEEQSNTWTCSTSVAGDSLAAALGADGGLALGAQEALTEQHNWTFALCAMTFIPVFTQSFSRRKPSLRPSCSRRLSARPSALSCRQCMRYCPIAQPHKRSASPPHTAS